MATALLNTICRPDLPLEAVNKEIELQDYICGPALLPNTPDCFWRRTDAERYIMCFVTTWPSRPIKSKCIPKFRRANSHNDSVPESLSPRQKHAHIPMSFNHCTIVSILFKEHCVNRGEQRVVCMSMTHGTSVSEAQSPVKKKLRCDPESFWRHRPDF